jgi:hypothetical protein
MGISDVTLDHVAWQHVGCGSDHCLLVSPP